MGANLEKLAKVDISLDTPVSNSASFDNILIIGPAPKNAGDDFSKDVQIYTSYKDVTEAGYVGIATATEEADPIGVAARVAFSQNPKPGKIYVIPVFYEKDEDENPELVESLTNVLNKALDTDGWYCVCPTGLSTAEVAEVVSWTEAQTKICAYNEIDPANPVCTTAGVYLRSFGIFCKESENQAVADVSDENKYGMAAGWAVKCMHYHAGSETWANKQIASVTPSNLKATFINTLSGLNLTYLTTVASKNITLGGKTNGGEWIDVIRFRDWLQNDMQIRIVNLLVVNPKIPYTDNGIGLVENQMLASLKDGQKYGGIAPTEYDADGNENPGYITSVPLASEITSVQKNSRILTDCKFSARLAGAIHLVEVSGSLTYENL